MLVFDSIFVFWFSSIVFDVVYCIHIEYVDVLCALHSTFLCDSTTKSIQSNSKIKCINMNHQMYFQLLTWNYLIAYCGSDCKYISFANSNRLKFGRFYCCRCIPFNMLPNHIYSRLILPVFHIHIFAIIRCCHSSNMISILKCQCFFVWIWYLDIRRKIYVDISFA